MAFAMATDTRAFPNSRTSSTFGATAGQKKVPF
jgi:hypothetical protein